ncbi:MAG: protein kinase [Actinomycetota bacterium]
MAAKREMSLLDEWIDPDPSPVQIVRSAPDLNLGIGGVTDLDLVSVSPSASVYRAVQTSLQRTVAIKVFHDDPSSGVVRDTVAERRITGQLTGHAGIVPLLEAGSTEGGKAYLVMPYYRRGSMTRLMVEHGALGWREAAFLIESVAVTIAEVHGRGLVHGNLTPSNVLLTDFLLPRVADFGHCVPIKADDDNADPRHDVAALGSMLWSLVNGSPTTTRPADSPTVDATTTAANGATDRPMSKAATVPAPLRALINRAMADDVDDRPANAAAFVTDLRQAVAEAERLASGASTATGRGRRKGAGNTSPTDAAAGSSVASVDKNGLAPSTEARYILALVACIAIAVLAMVLTAFLAVS